MGDEQYDQPSTDMRERRRRIKIQNKSNPKIQHLTGKCWESNRGGPCIQNLMCLAKVGELLENTNKQTQFSGVKHIQDYK